jgi:hypothetical protein
MSQTKRTTPRKTSKGMAGNRQDAWIFFGKSTVVIEASHDRSYQGGTS